MYTPSLELYEKLVDHIIQGVFAFDMFENILVWNRTMETINAITKQEVIGRKISDFFSDAEEIEMLERVKLGQPSKVYNKPFAHKEGFYEANMVPIFNDHGNVLYGLGIIHDVTEMVRMEEQHTKLKLRQQKEIIKTIVKTQEEERRRIAESLHNDLGQLLYTAKIRMGEFHKELRDDKNTLIEQIDNLLEDAISQTRTLSFQLIPKLLEDYGLKEAISAVIDKTSPPEINWSLLVGGEKGRLDINVEITIFRIIQELINNVIKHSRATQANINLDITNEHIYIEVSDNGIGFDIDNVRKDITHIGLQRLQSWVKLMNGILEFKSIPHNGTLITIQLDRE
ncbi:MAG TPA: PAS domain-containing sensor histidine kinase [Cytophagaceae bacterium]